MGRPRKPHANGKEHTAQNPKGCGRIPRPIPWEEVKRMAGIMCTAEEIAHVLGFTVSAIQRRCVKEQDCKLGEYLNRNNFAGKVSLRRLMWEKAQGQAVELYKNESGKVVMDDKNRPIILRPGYAPDTTMQIFLSKNLLGYADKVEHSGKDGQPIKHETTVHVMNETGKKMTEEIIAGKGTA